MIGKFFVIVVATLHLGFCFIEMFLWNTPLGRRLFQTDESFARRSEKLAANQGLYNSFLAAGLFLSFFMNEIVANWFRDFFLGCVVVAGTYGALTVSRRIFLVQAVPALLAYFFLSMKI